MEDFNDSLDSLDSQISKLNEELANKRKVIFDQNEIIKALRVQISDLRTENKEYEDKDQIICQKLDRLKREHADKEEELNSLSHAFKEMEKSNELLSSKLEQRSNSLKEIAYELMQTKVALENAEKKNEELEYKTNMLSAELDTARVKKRIYKCDSPALRSIYSSPLRKKSHQEEIPEPMSLLTELKMNDYQARSGILENELTQTKELLEKKMNDCIAADEAISKLNQIVHEKDQAYEQKVKELNDLKAKIQAFKQGSKGALFDEDIVKLREELDVTERSWQLERQHKERYAKENYQLSKQIHDLTKSLNLKAEQLANLDAKCKLLEKRIELTSNENRHEITNSIQFSMADEVGEFMGAKSLQPLAKPRMEDTCIFDDFPSAKQFKSSTAIKTAPNSNQIGLPEPRKPFSQTSANRQETIQDHKNRMMELARRNKLVKPIHQSSYPLELDTFDTINVTENEIKHGQLSQQQANNTNLPDQTMNNRVRKAEAFIV